MSSVMCGYLWQQSIWLSNNTADGCGFINGNEFNILLGIHIVRILSRHIPLSPVMCGYLWRQSIWLSDINGDVYELFLLETMSWLFLG